MKKYINLVKTDIANGFLPKLSQTEYSNISKLIYRHYLTSILVMNIEQLYVHVPFCPAKCNFCSFYVGGIQPSHNELISYVKCVNTEIKLYKNLLFEKIKNNCISSIYFGGGTPSLLSENLLLKLIRSLVYSYNDKFSEKVEITVEIRPEHYKKMLKFHEKFVEEFGRERFTIRYSVGVQTIDNELLNSVGRGKQPYEMVEDIVKEFQQNDILFNFDLMYLLPYQDLKKTMHTVGQFIKWGVPQISLYRTKYVEGTPIYKLQKFALLDKEHEIRHEILRHLEDAGYQSDDKQFFYLKEKFVQAIYVLGFGAGAFSDLEHINQINTMDLGIYLSHTKERSLPLRSFRILNHKEKVFEQLKIKIFKVQKFDEKELEELIGTSQIKKLEKKGLITRSSGKYIPTTSHRQIRWLIFLIMPFRDKLSLVYLIVKRQHNKGYSTEKKSSSGLEPPLAFWGVIFDIFKLFDRSI